MYDKAGLVLRVETVINNPEEFRVPKRVTRKGKVEWVPMRKGVGYRSLSTSLIPSQCSLSTGARRGGRSDECATLLGPADDSKKDWPWLCWSPSIGPP